MYVGKNVYGSHRSSYRSKIQMCATIDLVGDRESIPLFRIRLFKFAVKHMII